MILLKHRHFILLAPCLMLIPMMGCEFDDPYIPDSTGSSTLTGHIVTDPAIDLNRAEVFLRGRDSFATVTDANGRFRFQDVPPGDYRLQVQKKPYLLDSFSVDIPKSEDEDMGDANVKLKGAIAGTLPTDKVAIVHGEVELAIYIDGVPLAVQQESTANLTIDLSSPESDIIIRATTKITVYIDSVPYPATVQDDGNFVVEFVPPGTYSNIQVKLNSEENAFPIVSGGLVVVKGGQTRFVTSAP